MEEDEPYLRNRTDFYDTCNIKNFDFQGNTVLEEASENVCHEKRCVQPKGDTSFVGYSPDGTCQCEARKEEKPVYHPNYYTRPYNTRLVRETEKGQTAAGSNCRVQRSERGAEQRVCDLAQTTLTDVGKDAVEHATGLQTGTSDEEAGDDFTS